MKISVVIPAYNAENEISKCIENILNTNTCDFEVIVVNDGSTDNTKQILDDLANKDNRIKVIHQSNKGVSMSRNVGIEKADGDYIVFVDADDLLEANALDYLAKRLKDKDIDILQYSVSTDTYKENLVQENKEYYDDITFKSTKEAFSYLIEHGFYVVWNKTYKKDFIHEFNDFPIGIKTGEDLIFNCKTFLREPIVACDSKILYHHIRTNKDTTVTRFIDNMDETLKQKRNALLAIYTHFDLDKKTYYETMLTEYKFYVLNLFHQNSSYFKNEIINKIQTYIYSKDTKEEIRLAIPKNKSSKVFQYLVLHTNPIVIYKFYTLKNKLKGVNK